MPQWNQPGEPGQPGQPGQPPPQQPPRERPSTGKIVGFGCLGLFGLIVLIIIIVTVASGGGDEDGGPAPEETSSTPKDSPEESPTKTAQSYGDGDYAVGKDIPPGTYESAGAKEGELETCTITTEPKGDKIPQLKTADRNERIIITLSAGDGKVTVQGCEPLKKR